jgi:myo-inositol-1(or 4)-monophosphatase
MDVPIMWHSWMVNIDEIPCLPEQFRSLDDQSGRLATAWLLAHEVGDFLLSKRPTDLPISTKSTASDLVSEMDQGAEDMIVKMLRDKFPDDGILGEEGTSVPSLNGVRWIIDPLDGTVNYLFGVPLWGVSIAIEVDGRVAFGVISLPPQNQIFVGIRGHGSWSSVFGVAAPDLQKLSVRGSSSLSGALVMTGFGYDPVRRSKQAELIRNVIPHIADIRRSGSAVVDFCWLASGFSDAYFEYGLNAWDYAAGALIAQEAGATVAGLDEADFTRFLIAATPSTFSDLRFLLQECKAGDLLET